MIPKNTRNTPIHYISHPLSRPTWYLLISLPINKTEIKILKNFLVVVIVDNTNGGKCRTV